MNLKSIIRTQGKVQISARTRNFFTMHCWVNGNKTEISSEQRLAQLLQAQSIQIFGVAVAVNDIVISKSKWEAFIVNNNDKILIIQATQGG